MTFRGGGAIRRDVDAFIAADWGAGVQLAGLNLFADDMPWGDRDLVS